MAVGWGEWEVDTAAAWAVWVAVDILAAVFLAEDTWAEGQLAVATPEEAILSVGTLAEDTSAEGMWVAADIPGTSAAVFQVERMLAAAT